MVHQIAAGSKARNANAGANNVKAISNSKSLIPNEAVDDPHRLARLCLTQHFRHREERTLQFWRDEWHQWDGTAWRILPKKELEAKLTKSAKAEMDRVNLVAQKLAKGDKPPPVVRKITGRMISDVRQNLESLTILRYQIEAPAWLGGQGPWPAKEVLACKNGLLHIPSLVDARDAFFATTPRFFSPTCLDFAFKKTAPEPIAWLNFLDQLWPNDCQSINTMQEWMGYLLTPDTSQQKILMLVGPKRSGKGTIARVISALLGPANVVNPTLSSLTAHFGLSPLLGKTAAIISDARLSHRTDAATVTERLLSISGEDNQTVPRKFLPDVTAKLLVRFMILTNEVPKLGDSSGALPGRMILLRLTESWFGQEDHQLTDRLLGELPGILLWAIEGWRRLRENRRFRQPDAGQDLIDVMEDLSSPVAAFVKEVCIIKTGHETTVEDLFYAWKEWCAANGRKEPGTEQVFGRNLLSAYPSLVRVRRRDGLERYRAYGGIGLIKPRWQ